MTRHTAEVGHLLTVIYTHTIPSVTVKAAKSTLDLQSL
jgi:hypothetical protein